MIIFTKFEVYDYSLLNYSVVAADTLRNLVTLTFDLLTLVSGHTWRITLRSTKFEDATPIRS